jgi:predicted transposase/invertase (TIGR01784 family)
MKAEILELLEKNGITVPDAQEMLRKIFSKKKVKGDEEKSIESLISLLKENAIEGKEIAEVLLPFADPTFDTTFKMLFGSKEHGNILISLLNSLLDLSSAKKITALEIITETLQTPIFSYSAGESSISGAVDVLCTTTSGQKIAVEMQRAKQPYFLARTQHYMSKLISVQVNEKSGSEYHKEMLDTYILVLEKQNLFTGQHELSNKTIYEIEVEPTIKQTGEVFPGNKMHWKFFELSKFKEHNDSKNLTKDSSLKYQWLEFLIDCGNQLNEPDRHELIRKGYNIMKMMQWEGDKQALYWKEQTRELDFVESQKEEKEKAFADGKMEGIKEGELKGLEKGKLKGELVGKVKGEVGKIKFGLKYKVEQEKIAEELNYTKPFFTEIKDYFNSTPENFNKRDTMICEDLKLLGKIDMDIEPS